MFVVYFSYCTVAIKALYCHVALINYYDDNKMSESGDTFIFDAAMCFASQFGSIGESCLMMNKIIVRLFTTFM